MMNSMKGLSSIGAGSDMGGKGSCAGFLGVRDFGVSYLPVLRIAGTTSDAIQFVNASALGLLERKASL